MYAELETADASLHLALEHRHCSWCDKMSLCGWIAVAATVWWNECDCWCRWYFESFGQSCGTLFIKQTTDPFTRRCESCSGSKCTCSQCVTHNSTVYRTQNRTQDQLKWIKSRWSERERNSESADEKDSVCVREKEKMEELLQLVNGLPRRISFIREWFQVHCVCTDASSLLRWESVVRVMLTSPIAVRNVLELHGKRSECET